MKIGRSLQDLAIEVKRQYDNKRDLIVPTSKMVAEVDEHSRLALGFNNGSTVDKFPTTDTAFRQVTEYLGIPAKYADRCREAPELLRQNVAHWLANQGTENRLVRLLDGNVRAFLSDSYQPFDNYDLFEAIYPALVESNAMIVSCEITERKLYIKAVDKTIEREVPTGHSIGDGSHKFFDTVAPAIEISNSEIGFGQLSVQFGVLTRMCTNLAWISDGGMKRRHVGAKIGILDDVQEFVAQDTQAAINKAVFLKARDVVLGAFNETRFEATVNRLKDAAGQKIDADVVDVTKRLQKTYGLTDQTQKGVLENLIKGGDLTRYGLHAAVTRTAQDEPDYDDASNLERLGGRLIDLPKAEWEELSKAA